MQMKIIVVKQFFLLLDLIKDLVELESRKGQDIYLST